MVKRVALFVVLSSVLASMPAWAQQDNREVARRHYTEGQELFRAERWDAALAEFRAAYQADPHPVSLRSQAACLVHLGRDREAVGLYEQYLRELPQASDAGEVRSYIQDVTSRPGRIYIVTNPQGVQATLDGRLLDGATPINVQIAPGQHSLQLQAQGYNPETRNFEVAYGEAQTIQINLVAAAGPPATPPATPVPTQPSEGLRFSTPVWVMIGLTAAALVTGIVTGSLALSDQGEFELLDPQADPESRFQELHDSGQTKALIADISFGVAAAAAITGIVLFIVQNTGNRRSASRQGYTLGSPSLTLTPSVSENGGGISIFGRF
jgi:hypothetical protein